MQQNVASPQGVSEPSQGAVRSEASCQTSTGTGTSGCPPQSISLHASGRVSHYGEEPPGSGNTP